MSRQVNTVPQGGSAALIGEAIPKSVVRAHLGLRYGRLSDPRNPRSAVRPAEDRQAVTELTDVPVFPQLPSRLERIMGPGVADNPQSDEAFYLNIWHPDGAKDCPVLVFLHGGAWVSGGGSARWYRGEALAKEGMIVVTLNYRIGPAGHCEDAGSQDKSTPHMHRPMEDILTALRWVRDNIRGFGGDPARVTLAGQSAGAWYAWALAGWDRAEGLFSRVALMSIPEIAPWSAEHRHGFTQEVDAAGPDRQTQLRAGAKTLGETRFEPGRMAPMYLPVWPQTDASGRLHVGALYIRSTWDEMSVFLPPLDPEAEAERLNLLRRDLTAQPAQGHRCPASWSAAWAETVSRATWAQFGGFSEAIAQAAEARSQTVIRRTFGAFCGCDNLGATHCFDLPFQFGNRADWQDAPMLNGWSDSAFEGLSQAMRRDLAAFVQGAPQASRQEFTAAPDGEDKT
tara:strand:+ start:6879 stop:8240 length:1362 start_codon:yes stop_codon:yes gene_type:complete